MTRTQKLLAKLLTVFPLLLKLAAHTLGLVECVLQGLFQALFLCHVLLLALLLLAVLDEKVLDHTFELFLHLKLHLALLDVRSLLHALELPPQALVLRRAAQGVRFQAI